MIVAVQSAKSDEGNYEEIPSNTHEGSEPTYAGVVNQKQNSVLSIF